MKQIALYAGCGSMVLAAASFGVSGSDDFDDGYQIFGSACLLFSLLCSVLWWKAQ